MDGFIDLFTELITRAGIPERYIFRKKAVELPGFFRPTKEWDLLVVSNRTLIAAIEAKSQVGPSFGNNFNNRTEEAMGSALDLWTAFRERAIVPARKPLAVRDGRQRHKKRDWKSCQRFPSLSSMIT